MNKHPLRGMTLGEFRRLTANMADDCVISARDRDCISLDTVHMVNHPTIKSVSKTGEQLIQEGKTEYKGFENYVYFQPVEEGIFSVPSISDVYGGNDRCLNNASQQAIIFCDCD